MLPELGGTRLNYQLRGRPYRIDLDIGGSAISSGSCTLRDKSPFAVNATDSGMEYFPAQSKQWALSVTPTASQAITVQIENWPDDPDGPRQWTELAPVKGKTRYVVALLHPGANYTLRINGKVKSSLRADNAGRSAFISTHQGAAPQKIELRLKP